MCVPQIRLCLLTFQPIASKQLNSLTTIVTLLTRWCRGNASALGAKGPWLNARLRQGFYVCFVVVVFLLFCPKTLFVI